MEKLNLTLLLSHRLDEDLAYILNPLFKQILHDRDEKNLEALIRDNDFDVALEWQHGHQDHTVLDLVKKYNKKAKVILCLNWNGKLPADFDETDYFAYMDTPFMLKEMIMLLEKAKKSL